jgi:hypothetical protein
MPVIYFRTYRACADLANEFNGTATPIPHAQQRVALCRSICAGRAEGVARQMGHRDRVRFDTSREEFTRDRDFAAKIRGAWVSRGSLRLASIARATAAVR